MDFPQSFDYPCATPVNEIICLVDALIVISTNYFMARIKLKQSYTMLIRFGILVVNYKQVVVGSHKNILKSSNSSKMVL